MILAIDLGGTKTAMALVDPNGDMMAREKLPAEHSFEATIERIGEAASSGKADCAGLIVPGIYDPGTGHAWAPNLWGDEHVPLRDALLRKLSIPFSIGSDRAGYVLGEQWRGIAQGLNDVIFVAVGTGIGVGIVSAGRLIEGAHGIAGAAGWMLVGKPWSEEYISAGGWETEAAGPAVARRAGTTSADLVAAAARGGDMHALEIMHGTADYLAMGVANLIAILNPQMVIMGGGLMHAGDLMLDRIRSQALRWTQPVAAKLTRIEQTTLGEDAGLLGAARLALLQRDTASTQKRD